MSFVNRELPESAKLETLQLSQLALKAPHLGAYHRPEISANRDRLRELVEEARPDADRLVSAGTMTRGQLRTFSGGLAHENGRISSRKAQRLLHFEGVAQRALLIRSESDHRYINIDSECMRIETSDGLRKFSHTLDVVLTRADGSELAVEVKRDQRDIEDPELRAKYAATAEILRCCGIDFEIVFRDEIFRDRHHRANAELFASRAFTSFSKKHIDRLENLAIRDGPESSYGALAEVLEPLCPLMGKAVLQAFTVLRRVELDLTQLLTNNTRVFIH